MKFQFLHKLALTLLICAYQAMATEVDINYIRHQATTGNDDAQLLLGIYYLNGTGVPKNPSEAVKWFRRAAEKGNTESQVQLGNAYSIGSGATRDNSEAVKWWQRAAENGNTDAQYKLGLAYLKGEGTGKDEAKGISLIEKSAVSGNKSGQCELGLAYCNGTGVVKNDLTAASWFLKAANSGSARAQYDLATMYAAGEGVSKDLAEAVKWMKLSAEKNDSDAIKWLQDYDPLIVLQTPQVTPPPQAPTSESGDSKVEQPAIQSQGSSNQNQQTEDLDSIAKSALGSVSVHNYLWARYLVAEKNKKRFIEDYKKYQTSCGALNQRAKELKTKIIDAESKKNSDLSLEKGEFETTADYSTRKSRAVDDRNRQLQAEISSWNLQLDALQNDLNCLSKPTSTDVNNYEPNSVIRPDTNYFCVRVTMRRYDEVNKSVPGFTFEQRIQLSNDPPPAIFQFKGAIDGISISMDQAKKARQASDRKSLYALFSAIYLPLSFEPQYSVPHPNEQISPNTKTVASALIGLGAGLLAYAVGAPDPDFIAQTAQKGSEDDIDKSNSEKKFDVYPARIIATGWAGSVIPYALLEFNDSTQTYDVIWKTR